MTIQSDRSQVQIYATSFQRGGQGLLGVSQAPQDNLTTVSGNNNAHEALIAAQATRRGVSSAMLEMATNLNTIVSDIESADQEMASQISKGGG